MKVHTIHETKTHMSKLLREVEGNGKVIFGARGKSQYQITKVKTKKVDRSKAFGALKGKVWVADDAFSPETDAAIWKEFWEEDITDPNKNPS